MPARSSTKTTLPVRQPQADPIDFPDDNFGYLTINSDNEMDIDESAEPGERYDPESNKLTSKYFPICLGNILGGRYVIEHKIEFGGFSTVWLAVNMEQKQVALKATAAAPIGSNNTEIAIQNLVKSTVQDTSYLMTLLESFPLTPDGRH
ncbi:hypothetical protein N7462_000387 [Penicillium macrosclerotiorum]|uniref:uncharacterized protein n=1 Tax=Penicillium macrosclerotiorum TaxID=303699 RepID=UPI0025470612|nr:uncharacterized protein N7462_000387 [Penicillium macrosclerotiorum]KAJ5698382.1 hypothetical protein N7462_000387 [Penicillium macrosclerotiorum]